MDEPEFVVAWRAAAVASAKHDIEGARSHILACQAAARLAIDDLPCLETHWRQLVAVHFDMAQFAQGLSVIHKMSAMGRVERIHIPQIMAVEALLKDYADVIAASTEFAARLLAEPGSDSGADIEIVGPMQLLNPAPMVNSCEQRVWRRVLTQTLAIAKSRERRAMIIPDLLAPFCAAAPDDRIVLSFQTRSERAATLNVSVSDAVESARFAWCRDGIWHEDGISTQNPPTLRRKLEGLMYP